MSAALHSLHHPYSTNLHPPRNAIRTALIAAAAGAVIAFVAGVVLWSF